MIINKDEIKSLLSKGEIEKALSKLEESSNSNELITIRSWFSNNEKSYQLGIIPIERHQNECNRITLSLLNFAEQASIKPIDDTFNASLLEPNTSLLTREHALIEVNRKLAYAKHHLEQYEVINKSTTTFKDNTGKLFHRIKKVPKYDLVSFTKDFNYKLTTDDFTNFEISFVSEHGNYIRSDKEKITNDLIVKDHLISFELDKIDIDTSVDKVLFGTPDGFTLITPECEYCVVLMLLGGFKKKTGRRKNPHKPVKENFAEHIGTDHWKLGFYFSSEHRANDLMRCLEVFLTLCEEHRVRK